MALIDIDRAVCYLIREHKIKKGGRFLMFLCSWIEGILEDQGLKYDSEKSEIVSIESEYTNSEQKLVEAVSNGPQRMVSAKAKDDPMPDGEFAEFKEKVRFIIDNNPSGINFDVLTKELLSIAEKEIREKIASELQSMWEEKKDEWIGDNASRSQMAQGYDTGYSDAIKVIKEQA